MRPEQKYLFDKYTMGTCYYPEHWDKSLWESDLDRMLGVGISVIRIAEFAWSYIEPKEGKFDFSFYDGFLKLCEKKGMKVVMCTPTATPPAWLTEKYPEVLNKTFEGVTIRHGGRKHHVYNSEKYNELVARVVNKMSKHYGKNPCIIGWQIDNELNCEVNEYYSDSDDVAFREFLKDKYGKLEKLNDAWGTSFWNQQYTDWKEVHIPQPVLSIGKNPHRYLDYYRYISTSARGYLHMQAVILRKNIRKDMFITTNGLFWNLDNHKMTDESLDIYMYDSYPNFAFALARDFADVNGLDDRKWTKNLADTRSISPHFGIMEQQSGANGWINRLEGPAPKPGQLKLWALQSVSQGADFVSFFRWRTCSFGTEMYWHGILDYDNRDNRKLREVGEFYNSLSKINEVCGAEVVAQFAILRDYDNLWDTNNDEWHRRVHEPSERAIFEAAEYTHTGYDYFYISDDTDAEELQKYKAVFYPHPVIMTEARANTLKQYVENGGHLVIGCRSGYKDIHGKCVMTPQPGLLAPITGSDVYDFTFVPTETANEIGAATKAMFGDKEISMPIFNDIIRVIDETDDNIQVLAKYVGTYYDGAAAIVEKKLGSGSGIHYGASFSVESATQILTYLGICEPYKDVIDVPYDIQLVVRRKNDRDYFFTLNYKEYEQKITIGKRMRNLLSEEANPSVISGEYVMKPYEVCLWKSED